MSWKYEATNLERIYELIDDKHPDISILQETARKANKVAIEFDNVITDEFVMQYLNDKLQIDAISTLSFKASVLWPFKYPNKHIDIDGKIHLTEDDMDIEDAEDMSSYSHMAWLRKLSKLKGTWYWNVDEQTAKFENIMEDYRKLQELALSYPVKFP